MLSEKSNKDQKKFYRLFKVTDKWRISDGLENQNIPEEKCLNTVS